MLETRQGVAAPPQASTCQDNKSDVQWQCCARGCRHVVLENRSSSGSVLNHKSAAILWFGCVSLVVVDHPALLHVLHCVRSRFHLPCIQAFGKLQILLSRGANCDGVKTHTRVSRGSGFPTSPLVGTKVSQLASTCTSST